jgi:hypothetical protein
MNNGGGVFDPNTKVLLTSDDSKKRISEWVTRCDAEKARDAHDRPWP